MLNQDFKEFIESLNDNGVRYLEVGGYAVALHGYPRYTKDMDIWVEMTPGNATKILKALEQFGFGSLGVKDTDFTLPDHPARCRIFRMLCCTYGCRSRRGFGELH